MKVRVTLTIEVNPTEWAEQYGTGSAAREVAKDVRGYVLDAVWDSAAPIVTVAAAR